MATDFENTAQTGAGSQSAQGYEYDEGADIFGAGGKRLGGLSRKGVVNGYLVVHHGALFGKDAYVPLSCVVDTRRDGIYLNLDQDQLDGYDASEAPASSPDNVGGTAGGDTWTLEGQGAPGAAGEPINQPAPLRMRAPQQTRNMEATNLNANTSNTTPGNRVNRAGAAPAGTTEGAEEVRVPLTEEELIAGKRQTETGNIGLHKDVVEEEKTVNVPVTHEEVQVQHRAIPGGAVPADQIGQDVFQEKDIQVPVREEEVITGKRAQATDEVVINKTPVTENEQVSDTVRRERLRVDPDGVDVNNAANPHMADNLTEDQRLDDENSSLARDTAGNGSDHVQP